MHVPTFSTQIPESDRIEFVPVSKGFYTRMFAMHRVAVSNLRRPVLALGEEVANAMRAIEEAEGEGNAQSKN